MKFLFKICLLFGISLYGFEVNTHQALTRCAIAKSCSNGEAKNLISFVSHANLSTGEIYAQEYFERYKYKNNNVTYLRYIENVENAIKKYQVKVKGDYLGMIEAGSVLEDALYPVHDNDGDGRFNNHFYAAQFDSRRVCPLRVYMKTPRALCYGYATRTDNIDWALNKNVKLDHGFDNDYGVTDALYYFKKSFAGTLAERRKYQAKMFVSLGHVVHLLQDLHSPAHCRDNAHADGDYLEIYGRYDGGFNLRNGAFNSKNYYWITQGIRTRGTSSYFLQENNYYTYEDFFKKEAEWVGNNFASESHFLYTFDKIDSSSGAGLSINNFFDNSSLFDGRNLRPSIYDTFTRTINGYSNWKYVYTEGNTIANRVKGDIVNGFGVIGLQTSGLLGISQHMIAPKYQKTNGGLRQTGLNKKALESTAVNVMPRAVASTQAFIDYFFRGQMEATIDTEGRLTIKNVSDASTLSHRALATFKAGGKFTLYYKLNSGTNVLLKGTLMLSKDLPIGASTVFNLGKKLFSNIPKGTKITVVFDGNIGDNLGGYDSYGIGMKGASVDVLTLPYIRNDVYTFSVKQRGGPVPSRYNRNETYSFDIDIYKNGSKIRRETFENLLYVAWYNGIAHFSDSSKHHFDIWCQNYQKVCTYLRTRVPTNSTVGYQNWTIDWTVWNYGVYENNIGLFLYNIRNNIGKYYALLYASKSIDTKGIQRQIKEDLTQWIQKDKMLPSGLEYIKSIETPIAQEPFVKEDMDGMEEENARGNASYNNILDDLTQEEQQEMQKILKEELAE